MVRILIRFSEKIIEQPITAQTILECGVPINIISARIDSHGGEILAEIPSTSFDRVSDAFRRKGATVAKPELIEVDSKKCFNCGACISLCPVNAIVFKDFLAVFNQEKCLGNTCGVCVDACPARAIRLIQKIENNSLVSFK